MMSKKNIFFCIGAQKSGTTTLHDILLQNDKILLPKEKETHFFSSPELYTNNITDYFHKYFEKKRIKNAQIVGEIDPSYCFFEGTSKKIFKTFNPSHFNVKFIFILRDPVKRAYSQYLMSLRRGYETLSFIEAIENESKRVEKDYFSKVNFSYLSRGFYSSQIESYFEFFKPENFLFIRFEEDFLKQKELVLKNISNFLEIDYFDYNYNLKSNPASEPRSEFFRDLLYKDNFIKKTIIKTIPSKKIRRTLKKRISKLNLKETRNNQLPSYILKNVYESYFKEEIETLENNLNIDLTTWKHI